MNTEVLLYSCLILIGVFISAVSQVLLKFASAKKYSSRIFEYLNPLVIFAYCIFIGSTILSVYAYRVVPLSVGPILETTGYVWVTIFGVYIFKEKLNKRKLFSIIIIILGSIIYGFSA